MIDVIQWKAHRNEFQEYKNPSNPNVNNFKQGDIVILKSNTDLFDPEKLMVNKVLKSELICRDRQNKLISYAPEELLTAKDTEWFFYQQNEEQQRFEVGNQNYINQIGDLYRY